MSSEQKKEIAKDQGKTNSRVRGWRLLVFGIILAIGSTLFVISNDKSYQQSKVINQEIDTVETQISDIKEGTGTGDLDALQNTLSSLKDEKLRLEQPYSFSLTALFLAIALLLKGLYNAIVGVHPAQKADAKKIAMAGLMAALCYVGFTFFRIDITVGTDKTAFHLGNVFCVLAALLLGGYWGGLAGSIGMTIGDLTTSYVISAPKTFLLKLMIGLIVGLVAHKIFKVSRKHTAKFVTVVTILASACGMAFNVVADPTVGYLYKVYLLGTPQKLASAFAKVTALTTFVNAILAIVFASFFYFALRPALKKAGLFIQVTPEAEN